VHVPDHQYYAFIFCLSNLFNGANLANLRKNIWNCCRTSIHRLGIKIQKYHLINSILALKDT